jgi:transketolase
MRKQFVQTVTSILESDNKSALFLGDIGVFGFRDALLKYPRRAFNIGILEQATIGVAAGFALNEYTPIVHTIAPFLVERAYEQLKIDFGYQDLNGNFITVGASYDYAPLGCTHHCPGDVHLMSNISNCNVIVPGRDIEFDILFRQTYKSGFNYFRLSEKSHKEDVDVSFGKNTIIKEGKNGTIITVGPTLSMTLEATQNLDVTVVYCTTIQPFDYKSISKYLNERKIITIEPYYRGLLATKIINESNGQMRQILTLGVPHEFVRKYGTSEQHDEKFGLDVRGLNNKITDYLSL